MNFTRIALCALVLPIQSACAGDYNVSKADREMDRLERRGYEAIALNNTDDGMVVIQGQKSGKVLTLVFDPELNLQKKRVDRLGDTPVVASKTLVGGTTQIARSSKKVKGLLEADDDDDRVTVAVAERAFETVNGVVRLATRRPFGDIEQETDDARDEIAKVRDRGLGPQDIDEAEEAFIEAEKEEDEVRRNRNEADDDKSYPEPKKKAPAAPKSSGPRPMAEVEADTEDARAAVQEARDQGLGPQDIAEAVEALHEAEIEEADIRANRNAPAKETAKPKPTKPAKKNGPRPMSEVEADTENARAAVKHARENYGPQDIAEAVEALDAAETEEAEIRANRGN